MKNVFALSLVSFAVAACGLIPGGAADAGLTVAPTPPQVSFDGTKTCGDGGTPMDAGSLPGDAGFDAKTQACIGDYTTCATTQCESSYKECLGSDFKNGNFSGACQTFGTCAKNSNWDGCGTAPMCTIDDTCKSCLTDKIGSCVISKCVTPFLTCMGYSIPGLGSGSADSCTKLEACCNSQTGSDKADCLDNLSSWKLGGAISCNLALGAFQSAKTCK